HDDPARISGATPPARISLDRDRRRLRRRSSCGLLDLGGSGERRNAASHRAVAAARLDEPPRPLGVHARGARASAARGARLPGLLGAPRDSNPGAEIALMLRSVARPCAAAGVSLRIRSMPLLLSCQSIGKAYGTAPLFEDLSFGLFDEERAGL